MARWKERPRTGSQAKTRLVALPISGGAAVFRKHSPQREGGVPLSVVVNLDPSITVDEAAAALRLDEQADGR